jgi:hypothetical protein
MATRPKKSWAKAKTKAWKKNFAPKRPAWYAPLHTPIEPHLGFTALVLATSFFFGGVYSLETMAERVGMRPSVPVAAAEGPESQLAAAAASINRMLHVPSGYTDTSFVPPHIGQ